MKSILYFKYPSLIVFLEGNTYLWMFLPHDIKNVFLIFNHNFPYSNLCLLPLIPLLHTSEEDLTPSSLQPLFRPPWSFSRLDGANSFSLRWSRSNETFKKYLQSVDLEILGLEILQPYTVVYIPLRSCNLSYSE